MLSIRGKNLEINHTWKEFYTMFYTINFIKKQFIRSGDIT